VKRHLLASAAALMAAAALTSSAAASAAAATAQRPRAPGKWDHVAMVPYRPDDTQKIDIPTRCAKFKGDLSWGNSGGVPPHEAYIEITNAELSDTCKEGYAQLFIHWDTIDNPKTIEVAKVEAGHKKRTPYHTEDPVNNYKDIYVYVCFFVREGDYHCSKHYGPGASD
jgi:hypothetical protein